LTVPVVVCYTTSMITRKELIELALNSSDATVAKAVDHLLFVTQLAHGEGEQAMFNLHQYHYGAGFSLPPSAGPTEVSIAWANEDFAIRSPECVFLSGQAAQYSKSHSTPMYKLELDRNHVI